MTYAATVNSERALLHNQYQALLEISEAIAANRDLGALFKELAPKLHRVVQFDFANLILHDPARGLMKSHVLETPDPSYVCEEGECPMESPGGWVWETQKPWVVSDLASDARFPELSRWLCDRGVRSICVVPVTSALRKLGALAFGSRSADVYSEVDVIFLHQVARQVAVAVDNALNFAQAQSVQEQLKNERDRLSLLLEVNNTVVSVLDLHELLNAVSKSLRRLVPHEYASLSLYDAETDRLQIHALDFPVSKGLLQEGLSIPVEGSPTGRARLPAPSRNESADSSWPIEGRCFSMKSATFHWSFNPNSCACSKNRNLNGWAVREPFEWTCGWWPPPT